MTYSKLLDSPTPSSNQTLDDLLESMEDARCPVNQTFMSQPWIFGCRHSVDLSALIRIAAREPVLKCPLDRSPLSLEEIMPNIELAKKIKAFVDKNKLDLMEKYDKSDFPEGIDSWTDFTKALDQFIKADKHNDLLTKTLQRKADKEMQAYRQRRNRNCIFSFVIIILIAATLAAFILG